MNESKSKPQPQRTVRARTLVSLDAVSRHKPKEDRNMNKRTLASRVAALEADMRKEVEAFVEENKDVIPEWLLGWARGLPFNAVQTLVVELRKQGVGTKTAKASAVVHASALPPLPEADRIYMDKVFGNFSATGDGISVDEHGRVRASHLTRRNAPNASPVRASSAPKGARASAAVRASVLPPLPERDRAAMDRIFGNNDRPDEAITTTSSGGLRSTHLTRRTG